MLNRVTRTNILAFFPILGVKHALFHHYYVNCGYFVDAIYQLRNRLSFCNLLRVFIINRCWILSHSFSVLLKQSYSGFVFCYLWCIKLIDFRMSNQPLHSRVKSSLVMLYTSFYMFLNLLIYC